ncbi:MAG: hypothetical protein NZ576_11405, partial [Bacteroidia bacterium]|nr:hypothetical protein [Bacteroidia bacterium]
MNLRSMATLFLSITLAFCIFFSSKIKAQGGKDCVIPLNLQVFEELCSVPNSGAIIIDWWGGTQPYRFQWSGPNNFTSTTPNLTNISAGSYFLRLIDARQCTTELSIEVPLQSGISFYFSADFENKSIGISTFGTNPMSYILWKFPSGRTLTTDEFVITNLTEIGIYEATVYDNQGCSTSQSVYFSPCPRAAVKAQPQTCDPPNGKLFFTFSNLPAELGYSISLNSQVYGSTTIIENLPAGEYLYSIDFTNRIDCGIVSTIQIPSKPLLVFPQITHPNCAEKNDGQITLVATGGIAPYYYTWANGSTNPTQIGLAAGKYLATVTDSTGCQVEVAATLTAPSPINVRLASIVDANCTTKVGGSASIGAITGGTEPYIVRWSNNTVGNTTSNLAPGPAFVEVIDAKGCVTRQNFTLSQVGNIAPPTFSVPSICGTGSTAIRLEGNTQEWSAVELFANPQDNTPLEIQNEPPFTFITPILTTTTFFYLRATEKTIGCQTGKIPVRVLVNAPPPAPQVSPQSRCGAGSVTFSIAAAANSEVVLFSAPIPSNPIGIDATAPFVINTPSILTNTIFYIAARLPGSECYSDIVPAPATIIPSPGRPFAPDVERCGAGLITITAQMGDPAGSSLLLYSSPTENSPLQENTNFPHLFTINVSTTSTFYLEARSSCNVCPSQRVPVVVTIHNPPLPTSIRSNAPICEGGTLQFTLGSIVPGAIYEWQGPANYRSNNPNAQRLLMEPQFAGIYTLSIRTSNVCPPLILVSENIPVLPRPAISILASDTVLCQGSSLRLSAPLLPDATYSWSGPNNFFANTPQVTINNITSIRSGVYSLVVFLPNYPAECNQVSA